MSITLNGEPRRNAAATLAEQLMKGRFDGQNATAHNGDFIPHTAVPHTLRLKIGGFGLNSPYPAPGQQAIFACCSGLHSWRAADRLRPHWDGEIVLLADPPPASTGENT